jgi:hypothetical protein
MNNQTLANKLKERLAAPIHTEEQVLYALIGARKLIELGGYEKTELLACRFMTDWAVHAVIDRNNWSRNSLIFMDEAFGTNASWTDLTGEQQQRFTKILSLETGRIELMDVFRKAHIFPIALGHPWGWQLFLETFIKLTTDCSLKLKGGKVIDSVTLSMVRDANDKTVFEINWHFTRIDKQQPFVITQTMKAEKPDFHFGRHGREIDLRFEADLQRLGYIAS